MRSSFYLVKVLVNLKMPYLEFSRAKKVDSWLSSLYHLFRRKLQEYRSSFYLVKVLVNLKMPYLEFSRAKKVDSGLSSLYHLFRRKLQEYKSLTKNVSVTRLRDR